MGGSQSFVPFLPDCVHIVYAGRFVLASEDQHEAVVTVDLLDDAFLKKGRSSNDRKWQIHLEGENLDAYGRPLLCVIRKDLCTQFCLAAGRVVSVNEGTWTAKHRWLLEYDDSSEHSSLGEGEILTLQCHIRSLFTGKYLTVDLESGSIIFKDTSPDSFWSFCHAEHKCVPTCSTLVHLIDTQFQLQFYQGALVDALSVKIDPMFGTHEFSSLHDFLANGLSLGDDVDILLSGDTQEALLDVCQALYGVRSDFRRRIAASDDVVLGDLQLVQDAQWCGFATVQQTIPIAVLGRCAYNELFRITLSRTEDEAAFAVQMTSKLDMGFPMGDFLTETLHLFSQKTPIGVVSLRSLGLVHAGFYQQAALEGMQDSRQAYVDHALDIIQKRRQSSRNSMAVTEMPPSSSLSYPSLEDLIKHSSGKSSGSREAKPARKQEAILPTCFVGCAKGML